MKTKYLLLILALLFIGPVLLFVFLRPTGPEVHERPEIKAREASTPVPAATGSVPAHYETSPELSSLKPTLAPEQFDGLTREAYEVAKTMPQTLAQLPCYCHCDRGMGHKSLHSCFEDIHASVCDICVNEALRAAKLQRENGLTPAQIRDRIVAEYAN